MSPPIQHRRRRVATVLGCALAALGTALCAGTAVAAPSEPGIGQLQVTNHPISEQALSLTPGDAAHWSQDVELLDSATGTFAVQVTGSGTLIDHPRGLDIAVDSCTIAYDLQASPRPTCAGTETEVVAATKLSQISSVPGTAVPDGTHTWVLDDLRAGQARSFLVTVSVPPGGESDETLMGLSGVVGIGFFASGDSPVDPTAPVVPATPATPALPETGGPDRALMLVGLVMLTGGVLVVWLASRTPRRAE